jgi:hypothetical protein
MIRDFILLIINSVVIVGYMYYRRCLKRTRNIFIADSIRMKEIYIFLAIELYIIIRLIKTLWESW